jgi:general secretion pathway protein D
MMAQWSVSRIVAALIVSLFLAGCASDRLHHEAMVLVQQGEEQAALAKLEAALEKDPDNVQYRVDLLNAREQIIERLIDDARRARVEGLDDEAMALYRRALAIDPRHRTAFAGMLEVQRDQRHRKAIAEAGELEKQGDLDGAEPIVRAVLSENPKNEPAAALLARINEKRLSEMRVTPVLKPKVSRPVSLEFRNARIKMVFDALSRTSGINFLLDKDVRADTKITVSLQDVRVEDAIELIAMQSDLSSKVLSDNSVLVYPPQKQAQYQDLLVKSFYLDNAKVKQTVDMLKTVLNVKNVYVDESLNLVIIRDTPEAVRLAEKLIAAQDMAEPEVMLEMEVLEVSRSRLLELGIQWTDTYTFGLIDPTGAPFTLDDLSGINSERITLTPAPSATARLRKTDGDSNTLLSPRIRVRSREKASVVVADRLPVISSVVATGTGNPVVTDSISYLDVGLKLDVQPTVHLDGRVSITVNLEVSNLGEEVRTDNGSVAYRVGTRTAQTVLSMADGETQVLSGVINNADRKAATKIPGLGDLPVLGRLFGGHSDQEQNNEILLSITPRIINNVTRPEAHVAEFWSGSTSTLRTRPLSLRTLIAPDDSTAPAAGSGQSKTSVEATGQTQTNAQSQAASAPVLAKVPVPAPIVPRVIPPTPPMPAPEQGNITALFEGPAQAKVGETFDVTLWVKSADPVRQMIARVGYDPAILEAVAVEEGNFLNNDGARTSVSRRVDVRNRAVSFSGRRQVPSGIVGDGLLATITFRAKQASAPVQVELISLITRSARNQSVLLVPSAPFNLALTP